jgi:hypothetical protein
MSEIHEIYSPPFAETAGWVKMTTLNPPPEFWSAAKLDPRSGEIVLQLGVKPHPRVARPHTATVSAGFGRYFDLEPENMNLFQGHFEPHQITVRNHGAKVSTMASIASIYQHQPVGLVSGTPADVGMYFQIVEPRTQRVGVGWSVRIEITFTGDQTATAEILARLGPLKFDCYKRPAASADVANFLVPDASSGKNAVRLGTRLRKEI